MGTRLVGSRRLRLPIRVLSGAGLLMLAVLVSCPALGQQVPSAITYQGRLTDNAGQPVADGVHQVQFKLYTAEIGGAAFWTSLAQSVQTTSGLFTTRMEPITPTDLSGKTYVWLEVWAGNPLAALSPRVQLTASPFALRAGDLDLPFGRGINSNGTVLTLTNSGSGNTISGVNSGTGTAGSFVISNAASASDAISAWTLGSGRGIFSIASGAGNAVEGQALGTGSAGYFHVSSSSSSPALHGDTSGGGEAIKGYTTGTGNAGSFTINKSTNTSPALYATTNGTGRAGYFQIANAASSAHAIYATTNGAGDAVHADVSGSGSSGNAGEFSIVDPANSSAALVGGTFGTGRAGYFTIDNSGNTSDALYARTSGNGNGVNAWAGGAGDAVRGTAIGAGNAVYGTTSGSGDSVHGETSGSGGSYGGYFNVNNAANTANAVYGHTNGIGSAGYFQIANTASTQAALYATTNATSVTSAYAMYGVHSSSGNYGFIANGQYGLYGSASGLSDSGVYGLASADNGYGVYGSASNSGAGVTNYGVYGDANGESGRGGYFRADGSSGRGVQGYAGSAAATTNYGGHFQANALYGIGVYARGGSSGYAAVFSGNVKIQDRTSGATVMELGTGLDYAEGFDVSDKTEIGPGAVLVIDPENPGKLMVTRTPYDRKVAGIVAGAKDVGSGVRLGAGQFDHDVALAGRVYCNVDATKAGVEPGDLLTTSSTPGYAMKVADHARAQGAILGKAMQRLEEGKAGQILVLVTLQ